MQMRRAGVTGMAQQPELLSLPHVVADMQLNAARRQMRVHGVVTRAHVDDHAIAGDLRHGEAFGIIARRNVRQIAHHLDYGARRHGQDVGAVSEPVFRLLAIGSIGVAVSVNLYPVDGELLAHVKRAVHRIGDKAMRTDLQAASVAIDPAVALKRRADYHRLTAYRDEVAQGRVLCPNWSRRRGGRDAMRDRLRYLGGGVIGNVEEHDRRLSARDLRGVALFGHRSRQAEELHLAGDVFVLDVEHAVLAGDLVAARRIDNLDRLDSCGYTPGVGDLHRIGEMDESVGAFHRINGI